MQGLPSGNLDEDIPQAPKLRYKFWTSGLALGGAVLTYFSGFSIFGLDGNLNIIANSFLALGLSFLYVTYKHTQEYGIYVASIDKRARELLDYSRMTRSKLENTSKAFAPTITPNSQVTIDRIEVFNSRIVLFVSKTPGVVLNSTIQLIDEERSVIGDFKVDGETPQYFLARSEPNVNPVWLGFMISSATPKLDPYTFGYVR